MSLVWTLVSQPSPGMPLQSIHGWMQVSTWQMPAAHLGVACGTLHLFPHLPQLSAFTSVFSSQPSVALALQSLQPLSQVPMAHTRLLHAGVACGMEQTVPHAPQCFASSTGLEHVELQHDQPP